MKRHHRIVLTCVVLVLLTVALWWRASPSRNVGNRVVLQATSSNGDRNAELLAYEPFDYPAHVALVGQERGTGFDGPWDAGGFNAELFHLFNMKPGALTYAGLATRGTNHLSGAAPPEGDTGIAGVSWVPMPPY